MAMIPFGILPIAGIACLIVGMVGAYYYRWHDKTPLMSHHMTYIIRSVWWSSLVLLIGICLFCAIIVSNGDLSMIHALNEAAQNGIIPNENDVIAMQHQFLNVNHDIILLAAFWGLTPYPIYLGYRLINGVRKVIKNEG